MSNPARPPGVELFCGLSTPAVARVYLRFTSVAQATGVGTAVSASESTPTRLLKGSLRGPYCRLAKTLPTTTSFRTSDFSPAELYEAIVVDPCSWTPDLPATYQAELQFQTGDGQVHSCTRTLGLRALSVRNRSLLLDRRRVVLRGTSWSRPNPTEIDNWRQERLTALVADPTDEFCEAAMHQGLMLIADATGVDRIATTLRRLASWASVGLVVLSGEQAAGHALTNTGFLTALQVSDQKAWPEDLATDVVFATVADIPKIITAIQNAPRSLPVIVDQPGVDDNALTTVRARCARLQRNLAPQVDLAGYFV